MSIPSTNFLAVTTKVSWRSLCTLFFFNNARFGGPIFIIFILRRTPLKSCSSHFCKESIGVLT